MTYLSVSQAKYNKLEKELRAGIAALEQKNERLKALISEDLAAENAKLKMRIDELESELSMLDFNLQANEQDLDDLQGELPKIKADAIREAAAEVVRGVTNYDGSDVDVVNVDEIIDYADLLERGEL